jgi:hypothetical protein
MFRPKVENEKVISASIKCNGVDSLAEFAC